MKPASRRRPATLLDALVVLAALAGLLTLVFTTWIKVDTALESRARADRADPSP